MAEVEGVDYSYGRPGGKALAAAGKKFACRYVSNSAGKNIDRAEATDLAAHGVSSVVVWESTQKRPLDGRAAGVQDATKALQQARAAGMPAGRPVYFAVDWDATEAQQAKINAYFDGAASVIGRAQVGGYGGYWPLMRLRSAGLINWVWQTVAWSGSNRVPGMHILQRAEQPRIGGVACDLNTAYMADYGQWTPGKSPAPNGPTEVNSMDWKDKLTYGGGVWSKDPVSATAADWTILGNLKAGRAVDLLKDQATAISGLTTKVDALAVAKAPEIDYAKLAAALLTAIKNGE